MSSHAASFRLRKNYSFDNPQDLLMAKQTLIIDSVDAIQFLLYNHSEILKENPPGIYQKNMVDPVFKLDEPYYTADGLIYNTAITDINQVNQAVYDRHGRMVVTDYTMRYKKEFLSTQSQYSIYGIRAVYYFIQRYIEDRSAFAPTGRYTDALINCFKPEFQRAVYAQEIDLDFLFSHTAQQVFAFIENEPWTIYFVKQVGTITVVEKTVDFRIYDWTMQRYMQKIEEEERLRNY
jgi:hypothetical protein